MPEFRSGGRRTHLRVTSAGTFGWAACRELVFDGGDEAVDVVGTFVAAAVDEEGRGPGRAAGVDALRGRGSRACVQRGRCVARRRRRRSRTGTGARVGV